MFKIDKNSPPDYFNTSRKKVSRPKESKAWEDALIAEIRVNLRENILENEQFFLCAYCEKEIDATPARSNIDHFKTRNLFPQLTLCYKNLIVSCNTHGRCSGYKDSNIKRTDYEKMINPAIENPEDFFDYLQTGEIHPKENLDPKSKEKAEFTIDIFQLNNRGLLEERKKIVYQLNAYNEQLSLEEVLIYVPDYRSFIKTFFKSPS
jgi:uncharacterized protein (TIGR02646 family)